MNKSTFFFLFLLVSRLSAQDAYHNALNAKLQTDYSLPALTQWVLPNTEATTWSGSVFYGATVTSITPGGQIFSTARQAVVPQGNNPWDAAHVYSNPNPIASGDKCLLVIWLRSQTPNAKLNIFAEETFKAILFNN